MKQLVTLALLVCATNALGAVVGPVIPDADHDWVAVQSSGYGLGWFGTGVGDFDGDGVGDILVGDPLYDDDRGAARIYFGSLAGLPGLGVPPVAGRADAGWSEIGDPGALLGWFVSAIGDVNGDGRQDIVARDAALSGTFRVFLGNSSGQGSFHTAIVNCGAIGAAAAGDVNSDSYDDFVVHCGDEVGVFLGSPSGLSIPNGNIAEADWLLSFAHPSSNPEFAVPVGDVNGDGFDDILISFFNGAGSAYLFEGPLSGTATPADSDWSFQSFHNLKPGRRGGDVNGDGFDDIAIQVGSHPGEVHVFHGSSTGLKSCAGSCGFSDADWTVSGIDRPAGMPDDLVWVGFLEIAEDFGGDGFDDLLVTSRLNQEESNASGERTASIFFGGLDGLRNCAGTDPPSCVVTDAFWSVSAAPDSGVNVADVFAASAGDVNGDNGPDILVTFPRNTPSQSFVFHGIPDLDDDGFSVPGGDCDDGEALRYPGAIEALDGVDNQCPLDLACEPDSGSGMIDELPIDPENFAQSPLTGQLCWTRQPGADAYEFVAAGESTFGPDSGQSACSEISVRDSFCSSTVCCIDAGYEPMPGEVFHFLTRGSSPLTGSWGLGGSPPVERQACPGNIVDNGDFEVGRCVGGVQFLNGGTIPTDHSSGQYLSSAWSVQGQAEMRCDNAGQWKSASGSRDVALITNNVSSIRQTIRTQPSQSHVVSFALGATDWSIGQVRLVVDVDPFGGTNFTDSMTYTYDVPVGGFDGSPDQWQYLTFQFTSQSGFATLRLRNKMLSGTGAPVIDAITVSTP